jgi:diguanylate cyclase (GGDEF)-like protein/PAS domain S-box-containing protein
MIRSINRSISAVHYSPGDLIQVTVFVVAYCSLAILVSAWLSWLGIDSLFWPASGFGLVILLLVGIRVWPAIFMGAFATMIWSGHSVVASAVIAFGLTLEPVLGAWLIRRKSAFDAELKTFASYFWLILLGAVIAPISAAIVQTGARVFLEGMPLETGISNLFKWWLDDAVGVAMIAPLLLVWKRPPPARFLEAKYFFEFVCVLALHFIVGQIVFDGWLQRELGHINRGYWLYLFITWAAIRFGTHGVMIFVWLAASQGLVGAIHGVGFFGTDLVQTNLMNFSFYNVIVAAVGMSIATILQERRSAERQLHLSASVFTHAREGIIITDPTGTILDVNDTFTLITGYGHDEVIGKNPRILSSGRQPPAFYKTMWQLLQDQGHWSGEIWNRRKTGEVYAELLTISAVHDSRGRLQNYVALFTDITPMKERQHQLEHVAYFDALTGLPNRILLADRLQQAIIRSQRRNTTVAIAFIDLDGFKGVNDQYGHDVGDALLIQLSSHMREALRDGDTLARIGGDEFIAVLVDMEFPNDWEPVVNRLLLSAANLLRVRDKEVRVSASIGITLYPQDPVEVDQLLRHADHAMYQAKQSGKNCYHVFDVVRDKDVEALHQAN